MGAVVLTDDHVMAISSRSDIVGLFPELRAEIARAKPASGGCGRCNKNRGAVDLNKMLMEVNRVKSNILALSSERKDLLKKLLNASSLTLYVKTPNGVEKRVV